ncbi:hypothetical protein [Pseudomonas gozinkensis]|uniref:hypothetical protein n=1 Tax=Pseudomonas gozinkensis TaxID=2774461 RepID=UPI001787BD9C|nr:hypothetical protein [Pseudomonas gozinkensis]
MNRILLWLVVLLISGCVTHDLAPSVTVDKNSQAVQSASAGATQSYTGPETAAYLTEYYDNISIRNCRANPRAPKFLCSGVMLRATQHSTAFHFWNPNPSSTGVSFSWLNKAAKFGSTAFSYPNGFIFSPYLFAFSGKIEPEILCFYPTDGATTNRADKGCGASAWPNSAPCQSQGIHTAAQYKVHFQQNPQRYDHLCGFDVRDSLDEAATDAFNEAVKAQGELPPSAFGTQNEFRLEKWGQNQGAVLPIIALFYFNDTGKANAQYDQRDFKTQTGIWLPMIRMTLPQNATQDATFQFIPADQAISS